MRKAAFTICSLNDLQQAQHLLSSIHSSAHDCELFLLILEDPTTISKLNPQTSTNTKIVALSLLDENWVNLVFQYDRKELQHALKPFIFDYLFQLGYEAVLYFAPMLQILHAFVKLSSYLEKYDALLTPSFILREENSHNFQTKVFESRFIALKASHEVRRLIGDWKRALIGPEIPKEGFSIQSFEDYLFCTIPAKIEKFKLIPTTFFQGSQEQDMDISSHYSFDRYEDGEKILLSDRRKFLCMHPLEKKQLGNPFKAKDQIREIKHTFALLPEIQLVLKQYNQAHDLQKALDRLTEDINELKNSFSLKVGLLITCPLRKSWQFLKKVLNK